MSVLVLLLISTLCHQMAPSQGGILFPRDSETRQTKSLDGIWNFKLSPTKNSAKGYKEKWFSKGGLKDLGSTLQMPVPASYNDLTVEAALRDYIGVVWYDRTFFVPQSWSQNQRVWVRFGSVCYSAEVWVNGILVVSHEIGHLPFQADITSNIKFGEENLITVAVDNTLLPTTIPQGALSELTAGNTTILQNTYTFDFFNYAGIDRPVYLYTTPLTYINDVAVTTDVVDGNGIVTYSVDYAGNGPSDNFTCNVELADKDGNVVASGTECTGKLTVVSPKLWWPYLMDPEPGYLYKLKVEITDGTSNDVYRLPIGIRTVDWNEKQLLLNGKPVYIRGVGRHEDSDIRGKGLDIAIVLKDYDLLKWLGVNTYRTSHYPYAEEIMDMADEVGIMIIDECPSVNTDIFSDTLLEKHKRSLTELILRDKNRPSVIMWSIANEPLSQQAAADGYFKSVVDHVKGLDATRPVTIAISRQWNEDKAAQHLDIISINRYYSWYTETGKTDIVFDKLTIDVDNWYNKFQKPILVTEYGADAVAGIHIYPEWVWSEEYQILFMTEYFRAFDYLRTNRDYFLGEMLWNFADFKTAQTYTRVAGNKKGVFTRQRDPKSSAYYLRTRYHELANEIDGAPLPKKLHRYTSSPRRKINRTEL